jgi:hypothetical protein
MLGSVAEKYCASCKVRPEFYIREDGIPRSHCREILSSYKNKFNFNFNWIRANCEYEKIILIEDT